MTLDELAGLAEKATPGPWTSEHPSGTLGSIESLNGWVIAQAQPVLNDKIHHAGRKANAAFIAAANPATILKLLAVVKAAKELRALDGAAKSADDFISLRFRLRKALAALESP